MNENTAGPLAGHHTEIPSETAATPEMADLEAEIARTREDLASTVDQLTAKLDVKTRIRARAIEAKDVATVRVRSARQRLVGVDGRLRPAALGVGGVLAAIAAVVLVKLWQRPAKRPSSRSRRSRRR
jgi:hypothetical protein